MPMIRPEHFFSEWFGKPGATELALVTLKELCGAEPPADYVEFLRSSDGGEGRVGRLYITVWPIGEIGRRNDRQGITRDIPTLVGIADDGPHFYGLDKSTGCKSIVRIPLGDFDPQMWQRVASSFAELLRKLKVGEIW